MKRFVLFLVVALMTVAGAFAQADKIVGTYKAVRDGNTSKVSITKVGDGYRAQVIWVDKLKNADGTVRTDKKNPDAAKRNTPVDKIVLIQKVTFDGKDAWTGGKIYDPTSGKSYNVKLFFKDAKTLSVKGSFGPFSQTTQWTKLD